MRREKIFKVIITLIIGVVLFVMSTNVFAADSELNFFDDTTNQLDISNTTNTNTANNANNANANANINSNTNTNTNTKTSTNTSNYNTSLPKAGAPENTMIGVVATLLVSIYAYKKVNQYKNI